MKELNPKAIEFHARANTFFNDEKYNEAIAEYSKAIEIEPQYAAACYHLAEAYEKKKMDEQALLYYRKAIEYNPAIAENQISAGFDIILTGPFNEAVAEYKDKKSGSPERKKLSEEDLKPAIIELIPHVDPNSVIGTISPVIAKLLSSTGLPVKDVKVDFSIPPFNKSSDTFILKTPSASTEGKDNLTINTGKDGCATVFFKRKDTVGRNLLLISAPNCKPIRFEDNTISSSPTSIQPLFQEEPFPAGKEKIFSFKLIDKFNNPVRDFEVECKLNKVEGGKFKLMNAQKNKTDNDGVVNFKFMFFLKADETYRIEILSPIHYVYTSNTVSQKAEKLVFLNFSGEVKGNIPITLSVKVLDANDNPVKGEFVAFQIKDYSGKKGEFPDGNQNFSDDKGIVSVIYIPSSNSGDSVEIFPSSPTLSGSEKNILTLQTTKLLVAQKPDIEKKEKAEVKNSSFSRVKKEDNVLLENLIPIDINNKFTYVSESNLPPSSITTMTSSQPIGVKDKKDNLSFTSEKNRNKEVPPTENIIIPEKTDQRLAISNQSASPVFEIKAEKKVGKKGINLLEKIMGFLRLR